MTPVRSRKPLRSTWSDGAATLHGLGFDKSRNGKRVAVWFWDDGRVELKAIKGDGRTSNFREFERVVLPARPASDSEVWALARAMADRHFAGRPS
jgi:hypothetical protein